MTLGTSVYFWGVVTEGKNLLSEVNGDIKTTSRCCIKTDYSALQKAHLFSIFNHHYALETPCCVFLYRLRYNSSDNSNQTILDNMVILGDYRNVKRILFCSLCFSACAMHLEYLKADSAEELDFALVCYPNCLFGLFFFFKSVQ